MIGRRNAQIATRQDFTRRPPYPSQRGGEPSHERLSALYAQLSSVSDHPHAEEQRAVSGAHAEVDMMRAIGGNWEAYRGVWTKMRAGESMPRAFSTPAAFSTPWLLYRKLYGYFFAVIAAQIAIGYVMPGNGKILSYVIGAFFGVYGKALVVQRCVGLIDSINQMPISREDKATRIAKAGGTNLMAVFGLLGFLLLVALVVVAVIASAASNMH